MPSHWESTSQRDRGSCRGGHTQRGFWRSCSAGQGAQEMNWWTSRGKGNNAWRDVCAFTPKGDIKQEEIGVKSMTCLHSNEWQKSFHPAGFGISGGNGQLGSSFSALVLPQTHCGERAVTHSWCQVPNATTPLKQKAFSHLPGSTGVSSNRFDISVSPLSLDWAEHLFWYSLVKDLLLSLTAEITLSLDWFLLQHHLAGWKIFYHVLY